MTDIFHAYYVCKGRDILQDNAHSLQFRGAGRVQRQGPKAGAKTFLRPGEAHYPDGSIAPPAPVAKLPAISNEARPQTREDPVMTQKAFAMLQQADFIKGLEEKTVERVAKAMVPLVLRKGDVLFRQGDIPGKCYGIVSGSVDIYVLPQDELDERNSPRGGFPRPQVQSLRNRPRTAQKEFQEEEMPEEEKRLMAWEEFGATLHEKRLTWTANCDLRLRTYEGASTWGIDSKFGRKVFTQEAGSIVGERAMVNDDVRAATVVCSEDCEFLEMGRQDFDEALSDYRKQMFLAQHLPDVSDHGVFSNGVPATSVFQMGRFPKGTVFLRQGVIEEDVIYVLFHGSVEFCRSTQKLSKFGSGKTTEVLERWDVLHEGSMFGSLRMLPIGVPEVFSVQVQSPLCDVLFAYGSDIQKLPPRVREELRESILTDATRRLKRRFLKPPRGHVPPPLKRDIGMDTLQEGGGSSSPSKHSSSCTSLPAAGRTLAGSPKQLSSKQRFASSMPALRDPRGMTTR
mmetsp:Transcript_52025/g.123873  ORF Transcript_52025/g.123873 Transcript_52025/m.123873 type:complete len:512 (+) Transcript_52025:178-1713(+)